MVHAHLFVPACLPACVLACLPVRLSQVLIQKRTQEGIAGAWTGKAISGVGTDKAGIDTEQDADRLGPVHSDGAEAAHVPLPPLPCSVQRPKPTKTRFSKCICEGSCSVGELAHGATISEPQFDRQRAQAEANDVKFYDLDVAVGQDVDTSCRVAVSRLICSHVPFTLRLPC